MCYNHRREEVTLLEMPEELQFMDFDLEIPEELQFMDFDLADDVALLDPLDSVDHDEDLCSIDDDEISLVDFDFDEHNDELSFYNYDVVPLEDLASDHQHDDDDLISLKDLTFIDDNDDLLSLDDLSSEYEIELEQLPPHIERELYYINSETSSDLSSESFSEMDCIVLAPQECYERWFHKNMAAIGEANNMVAQWINQLSYS